MTTNLPTTGRAVVVRAVSRTIPPYPDGTSAGYRVDAPDNRPRITYSPAQLTADQLGAIVHQLATATGVH